MTKVKGLQGLTNEINKALREYTTEVTEELNEAKKEVAKNSVKTLKRTSPMLTGSYRKGWRASRIGTNWVVHNKTDYQLTHLLEKGHAKRGGGRVSAQPHIRPVEQEAIKEFENRVERAIRG